MADQALRARGSELWIWALVLAAIGSVVALSVSQARRPVPAVSLKRAPQVTLPLLGGGTAALPEGKVTLVDFWATWCAPCRVSMPRLQRLWNEYQPRGVELYSVDTDDTAPDRDAQLRAFLDQHALKFPVVIDDGTASDAFSISRLPTLVLLDRTGSVVWSRIGLLTPEHERDLRDALERAIGAAAP
ncbi:MAG TPA: TlpA disulfide reductase family protein [Myxococcales bacterium]|nr:TlpA disulfide reductase family protein [Myxococcales bacterium]